jgi:hypothetical protein
MNSQSFHGFKPIATVIGHTITLAGGPDSDPFGQVTDGQLKITGNLKSVSFVASDDDLRKRSIERTNPKVLLGMGIDGKHLTIKPQLVPDVPVKHQLGNMLFSIPQLDGIGAREFYLLALIEETNGVAGLILLGTGVKGEYHRRGWWQLKRNEWGFEEFMEHRAILSEDDYMTHEGGGKYVLQII